MAKELCDRCEAEATYKMLNGKFFLCSKCRELWNEKCKTNGITGGYGKRNYNIKYYDFFILQFEKFLEEGQPFVFR